MFRFSLCLLAFNVFLSSSISEAIKPAVAKDEDRESVQPQTPSAELSVAGSIAVSDYHRQDISPEADIRRSLRLASTKRTSSSTEQKYGYPYRIAPTLPPFLRKRSDEIHSSPVYSNVVARHLSIPPVPPVPPVPETVPGISRDGVARNYRKKQKPAYGDKLERSGGYDDDTSSERRLQSYREPQYRNFDDLDTAFKPRPVAYRRYFQVYNPIQGASSIHPTSPRDPYLSPSSEPYDSFYPKVYKTSVPAKKRSKGYSPGYYDASVGYPEDGYSSKPEYGERYGDRSKSYSKNDKYNEDFISHSQYPNEDGYDTEFTVPQNSPIIGEVRKRLLDYAGASDLFGGEPDYLSEAAARKKQYENIGNDYYPFRRSDISSFKDFEVNESKQSEIASKA